MDPQQRLLVESGYTALSASGARRGSLPQSGCGVFVGITTMDWERLTEGSDSVYAATGAAMSIASGRTSYVLGLQGACLSVDTACSASLVAWNAGAHALAGHESTDACGQAAEHGQTVARRPRAGQPRRRRQRRRI